MGTGASLQASNSGGKPERKVDAKKVPKGPIAVNGKPYVFYPAHCSASVRPNNLSSFGKTLVFASKDRVAFVETGETRLKNRVFRSEGTVYQTKACKLNGPSGIRHVLVVAQTSGLVLWDFDEQTRISKHPISSSEFSEKNVPFARGITNSDNQILVGTSAGRILVFDLQGKLEATLNTGEHAITDMVYYKLEKTQKQHLSVCTADGKITNWSCNLGENLTQLTKDYDVDNTRSSLPVSLALLQGNTLLVAGFSCGHIRVYSIERKCLVAEIAAHARPISSLTASTHGSQILSSGEDSVINLWNVSDDEITLEFSDTIQGTFVVGSCFINDDDKSIAAAAYDHDGIYLWQRTQKETN